MAGWTHPAGAEGLWPLEFANKVRDAGGAVNFVFGAKRPFPQCHASTVAETKDGLVAAWFGGTAEKDDDVGIWYANWDGKKWTDPQRAAKINDTPHWNPVLFRDDAGTIHLFFKVGPEIPFWQTYWMQSENGRDWSDPVELVPGDKGGRGPVKNKAIILSDGTWLAPASTEHQGWNAFADRSGDQGKTWERSANFEFDPAKLTGKGIIQPTFWESEPGQVHALMRSTSGHAWRTDSSDGGKTWTPVYDSGLPNNNSGFDAVRLEDGRILLVYNPVAGNWAARTPLDLAMSEDNGKTWKTVAHLEADPDLRSEFSYPAIIQTTSGDVVITYTYQRERVRCWIVPLSAL
ncbi:MAG: exo-alpha-sialidase [Candidatus Hydrogenedentes bacterium]|nr:exo-alpha-sialidase [Candidatus Hydrogenedentota bacterium]